jgi:hypothetical protein
MASGNNMASTLDRLGGSLINAVLGGLILWVGQTTVRHTGVLAGVDEKLAAINHQFVDVDKRQESMRKWLENVVNDMKDSSRLQFTLKDGDKLVGQVRQAEIFAAELERRLFERLAALEIKLAALESRQHESKQVAALQIEVAQLRSDLGRAALAHAAQYQSPERVAGSPVFLPPVDGRR